MSPNFQTQTLIDVRKIAPYIGDRYRGLLRVRDSEFRLTIPALKVLNLFRDNVRKVRSGAEIGRETKLGPGTLYPLLARFENHGLFTSKWEDADPSALGRPRRRLYKISGLGIRVAQDAIADVQGVPVLSWAK